MLQLSSLSKEIRACAAFVFRLRYCFYSTWKQHQKKEKKKTLQIKTLSLHTILIDELLPEGWPKRSGMFTKTSGTFNMTENHLKNTAWELDSHTGNVRSLAFNCLLHNYLQSKANGSESCITLRKNKETWAKFVVDRTPENKILIGWWQVRWNQIDFNFS